jgi:hypothetical protein
MLHTVIDSTPKVFFAQIANVTAAELPKMTNTLIAIQNATSNGIIELYSSSSDFWTNVGDICAISVVFGIFAELLEIAPKTLRALLELKWACIINKRARIESWLAWIKKYDHWIEVWGFFFWMVIVVALAGELLGSRIAKHFDSLTIGYLNTEAADAWALANRIGTTNGWLVESNLVLQAKIETLQARRIGIDQEKKFINILENCHPKIPIKVFVGERDGETDDYAAEIRTILDEAGYGSGKTNDITELGELRFPSRIGVTIEDFPLVLIVYATNNFDLNSMWIPNVKIALGTNSDSSIITYFTGGAGTVGGVLAQIDNAFPQIGINPEAIADNKVLKPGEWGIFVPKKF